MYITLVIIIMMMIITIKIVTCYTGYVKINLDSLPTLENRKKFSHEFSLSLLEGL